MWARTRTVPWPGLGGQSGSFQQSSAQLLLDAAVRSRAASRENGNFCSHRAQAHTLLACLFRIAELGDNPNVKEGRINGP